MGLFLRFKQERHQSRPQLAPLAGQQPVAKASGQDGVAGGDDESSILDHLHYVHRIRHHKQDLSRELLATYSVLPPEYVCGDYELNKERLHQIRQVKEAIENLLLHPITDNKRSLGHKYGKMTETLGKGSYGLIRLVEGKQVYALKQLKVNPKEDSSNFIDRILLEFAIGSCVDSCHVSRAADLLVTYDDSGIKLGQLIPFNNGGDLFAYLQNDGLPTIDQLDCFVKQIALGLQYLHSKGISHCDIKMENVFLNYEDLTATDSKITLVLGDFGKSQFCKSSWGLDDLQTVPLGSEPYMAPEEYEGKGYSTFAKDCWAFGVLMTAMFSFRKPFSHVYPWKTTAFKVSNGTRTYVDPAFSRYIKTTMAGSYNPKLKEWRIKKNGSFKLIEELFDGNDDSDQSSDSDVEYIEELNKLRQLFIYKFLDPDSESRMKMNDFLPGDWMIAVDVCMEYDD